MCELRDSRVEARLLPWPGMKNDDSANRLRVTLLFYNTAQRAEKPNGNRGFRPCPRAFSRHSANGVQAGGRLSRGFGPSAVRV